MIGKNSLVLYKRQPAVVQEIDGEEELAEIDDEEKLDRSAAIFEEEYNKELSDAKETYKKKSLLERIKQILKSKTNNEPNDSMKM